MVPTRDGRQETQLRHCTLTHIHTHTHGLAPPLHNPRQLVEHHQRVLPHSRPSPSQQSPSAKQNPISRFLEEVRSTVHMRQTFHEYFIYTRSEGVNTSKAPGFMGAERANRNELGHKTAVSVKGREEAK